MKFIYKISILTLSILCLNSCSKDTSDDEYPPGVEPPNFDVWYDMPGALTVDHIWCDGTTWIEGFRVTDIVSDIVMDGAPEFIGYVFIESSFKEVLIFGKKYLHVLVTNPYDNTDIINTHKYLRRDGRKIYGLDIKTGVEILYHDFHDWLAGNTLHFNYFYAEDGDILEIENPRFYRLTYDMTLPYYLYGDNNDPEYVRYIGLINHPLASYFEGNSGFTLSGYGYSVSSKGTILEISSGKTSEVVFRHPKLDEIMSNESPILPEPDILGPIYLS